MTPSERMLRQFTFVEVDEKAKNHLQTIRGLFKDLAQTLSEVVPESAEKTVGLRKLLESKDCFVRAALESHFEAAAHEIPDDPDFHVKQ